MKPALFMLYSILLIQFNHALKFLMQYRQTHVRSPLALDLLAKAEIQFVKWLNDSFPRLEGSRGVFALEYLKIYNKETQFLHGYSKAQSLAQKVEAITSSSFSIYQHVRRWLYYLAPVVELQRDTRLLDSLKELKGYTREDLNESMTDMLQALHIYNFDVPLAVAGTLRNFKIGTELNAEQCLELGGFARDKSYHALSIQFYEEALTRAGSDVQNYEVEILLKRTIKEHDDLVRQKSLHPFRKQLLFNRRIGPLIKRYGREQQKSVRIYQRVQIPWIKPKDINEDSTTRSFGIPHAHDICLYHGLQTDEEKRDLFCWYESTIHLYFTISPLKMELLSAKPELIQIYEVNPPKRIHLFKETYLKKNNSNIAGVNYSLIKNHVESILGYKDVFNVPFEQGILSAFQAWDSQTKGAGLYQFHAEAPGSKFGPHVDLSGRYFSPETGVGISVLYYLEEPEAGGETIFLYPRVAVKPVPGSSIIFISSLNGGSLDFEMAHASCPVLLGRKYLIVKNLKLHPPNPQCSKFTLEKFKLYPRSKILRQKLYPKLKTYLENTSQAGVAESHIYVQD